MASFPVSHFMFSLFIIVEAEGIASRSMLMGSTVSVLALFFLVSTLIYQSLLWRFYDGFNFFFPALYWMREECIEYFLGMFSASSISQYEFSRNFLSGIQRTCCTCRTLISVIPFTCILAFCTHNNLLPERIPSLHLHFIWFASVTILLLFI